MYFKALSVSVNMVSPLCNKTNNYYPFITDFYISILEFYLFSQYMSIEKTAAGVIPVAVILMLLRLRLLASVSGLGPRPFPAIWRR